MTANYESSDCARHRWVGMRMAEAKIGGRAYIPDDPNMTFRFDLSGLVDRICADVLTDDSYINKTSTAVGTVHRAVIARWQREGWQ